MVITFWILKIFDILRGVSLVHMSISTYVNILGLANQSNSINVIEYLIAFIRYHLYYQLDTSVYLYMSIHMFVHMNTYSYVNSRVDIG